MIVVHKLQECQQGIKSMQILSKDSMEMERQMFCNFNVFNFNLYLMQGVRVVLHKPSLQRKEFKGFRCGLAKPEVQPILSEAIYPVLPHDDRLRLCNMWWEISNVCMSNLRDLPHTYICTCFLFNKETKLEQARALPV